MTNTATSQATGPITLADVRAALGDTDANATNAGALRAVLGRGSYGTVQKHLDAIRLERAPVIPVSTGTAPAAPVDAVTAIWSAAWGQAQALTLGALATAITQRDASLEQCAHLTLERDAFAEALDVEVTRSELAQATAKETEQSIGAELKQALSTIDTLQAELVESRVNLAAAALATQNAAEVAARDAQLLTAQHRANTEHLLDQVANLKTLLAGLTLQKD